MEPMNPSTNSGTPTIVDIEFANDSSTKTVPLLIKNPPIFPSSKSSIFHELRNFRIILKWCGLDHSTCTSKFISYLVFIFLNIIIPILSSIFVHVPSTSIVEDPVSFNKLVQLPESCLSIIAFFTLSSFLKRFGLRHLLFLDELQDDSMYVRRGYTQELDRSFRHLVYILLPSFFVELAHKILFFSTVTVRIPYLKHGLPYNSIMFLAVLVSWVYRTGVFLLVCSLFRLTCELQILRFEGFKKLLEGCGSDSGVIFREHMRIRKHLSVTSHRYRFFIIACLITITVSQFGVLLLVLGSKSEKNFFNSGDLVVCSAVQLSGFLLSLLGAARITHRAQGIAAIASKWNMIVTSSLSSTITSTTTEAIEFETRNVGKDLNLATANDQSNCIGNSELSPDSCTAMPYSQDSASSFRTRQALVNYLQHNNGGITIYGFALDRGLLHTLFAFEFSLVLWILSKVVVLS